MFKSRKVVAVASAAVIMFGLAACSTDDGGGGTGGGDAGSVGISMPTRSLERWINDGEGLQALLEDAGYTRAEADHQADVVVFNTCAVRENADNKLYGNLGMLASVKKTHEGMQIAVGGCLAQKDKSVILEKAPWVAVVF